MQIPRWAWISTAFGLVLVPVLLVWLAFALLGSAQQAGSGLLEQARSWIGVVAPDVAREADAALAEVRQAAEALTPLATNPVDAARTMADAKIAEVTAAVREPLAEAGTALGALAALPTADVAGEHPEGFTPLPGFVRTAFQRGDDGVAASYVGVAPQAEVIAFHRQALEEAGYTAVVQSADANGTTVEFSKAGRTLLLAAESEPGGRTRLEVRSS
jgi:hypothetical protein